MIVRMKEKYDKEALGKIIKECGLENKMQAPYIEKVVVNVGAGKILNSVDPSHKKKVLEKMTEDLALITGQKPLIIQSRIAIAAFKLRKGMPVGLKVTLRGMRMYDFLDRLVHIALPRLRDFRGLDLTLFDKEGNLNIGFKEHTIFPEIVPEKLVFGLEVNIVVRRAKNREQSIKLFKLLGFPIKNIKAESVK